MTVRDTASAPSSCQSPGSSKPVPIPSDSARAQPPRLFLVCLLIFVTALAIRLFYALPRPVPLTVDAAYYLAVAENIYGGRGLVCDYVWNYLAGLPSSLPVPSNEYWMPGASIVTAAAFALTGSASLRAAQAVSLLLGALLCAITAWIGGLLFQRRSVAFLAGAFAVISFHLVGLALCPDHFMLAAVLVNLSLIALWLAWRGRTGFALLAGALAALAYLTRTDGALLAIVALLLAIGLFRRRDSARALRLALYFLAAFALVSAPWWVHQTIVFGHPSGAGPLRTAFLTGYNDLFRLDQSHLNLRDYLRTSQVFALFFKGYVLLWELRLLARATLLVGLLALVSLLIAHHRRQTLPWLIYLALAIVAPALIVPYPARKGVFWHLLPGLCPVLFVLGAATAVHMLEWAKRSAKPVSRLASRPAIILAFGSLLYWWACPPEDDEQTQGALYPPVALDAVHALGTNPPPVLTDNSWGLYHVARIPCAQFPADGADAALRVADSIGAAYFITRADAPDKIPAISEVASHPRFQPFARYQAGETRLLVYRILAPEQLLPQSPSASRRSMSQ